MDNFPLNKPSLGRGLSSLIPKKDKEDGNFRRPVAPAAYLPRVEKGVSNQILYLPPAAIAMNPYQPRQQFGDYALASLKNSIREHGIIQPLIVTQTLAGKYELVAGERRLRAARELNLKTVPVIVRTARDLEKLELSLIENIQREDLNPLERAHAYRQLIDNFHLTQEEAAKRLGIARSTLNNALRLLGLPDEIKAALANNKISEGQAKLILSLTDEREQQKIFKKTAEHNLTVKDLEREVGKVRVKTHLRSVKKDPELGSMERQLQELLATRVTIRRRGQGGVIEIEFYAAEELRGIINNILKLEIGKVIY